MPATETTASLQSAIPLAQRQGHVAQIGGFDIFVADDYGPSVREALNSGQYEARERALVTHFLRPGDRVIELGTAVGVVAMTAAAIIGAPHLLTFEANPYILADARENFARNKLPEIASHHAVLASRRHFQPGATAGFREPGRKPKPTASSGIFLRRKDNAADRCFSIKTQALYPAG